MDKDFKKGINFDLNTEELRRRYEKGDWHNAYYDIRRFLEGRGFEHIQGSGYHSRKPMAVTNPSEPVKPLFFFVSINILLCQSVVVQTKILYRKMSGFSSPGVDFPYIYAKKYPRAEPQTENGKLRKIII